MTALSALFVAINTLVRVNSSVLKIAAQVAWVLLAMMVFVIFIQVFFRSVLNDALSWPDESARFYMLWMTGLIAPSAYRVGGFVGVDSLQQLLPRRVGLLFSLLLLLCASSVLFYAIQIGWNHTFGFGGILKDALLIVPLIVVSRVKLDIAYVIQES